MKIAIALFCASTLAQAGVSALRQIDAAQVRLLPGSPFYERQELHRRGYVASLTLPAALRLEQATDAPSVVSVFFGPVVLAGELGREHMPNDRGDRDACLKLPAVAVPEIVSGSTNSADWLRPIEGATAAFRAHDAGPADGIVFRPLHEVHHQRYAVYWRIHQ